MTGFSGAAPVVTAPPWMILPGDWAAGAWFTAKQTLSSTPAWIMCDGDSVTNGVNPANLGYIATGWPDKLRSILLARNLQVYADFYSIWAYTFAAGGADPVNEGFATPVNASTQYECGFGTCLTDGGTPAVVFQTITTGSIPGWLSGSVTGFDIVYYDFGIGTWAFTIDGGEGTPIPVVTGAIWSGTQWVVTNAGGGIATGNVKKVTVRGLDAGSHVIAYGFSSVAGNTMFIGLSLFTGNTFGIGFCRSAYSGRRAVDAAAIGANNGGYAGTLTCFPNDRIALMSGAGPTNATANITPVPFGFPTQPALAFIGYGINDAACGVVPSMYCEAIQRRIIAYRRGNPNCNIGLIAFAYPDSHNSDNNLAGRGQFYLHYKRELQSLAAAYNCAYIDVDAWWGGNPVAKGYMVSGNVHPTAAGHQAIAQAIAGII